MDILETGIANRWHRSSIEFHLIGFHSYGHMDSHMTLILPLWYGNRIIAVPIPLETICLVSTCSCTVSKIQAVKKSRDLD